MKVVIREKLGMRSAFVRHLSIIAAYPYHNTNTDVIDND